MKNKEDPFVNPYLAGIAAFIALMTFVSTMLYFQQAHLVAEYLPDQRPDVGRGQLAPGGQENR